MIHFELHYLTCFVHVIFDKNTSMIFEFIYLFNSTVTIKIMRFSVYVEGVPNKTHTVTNIGEDPEVLKLKEEDIEDNKKIIVKFTMTDKFGDELT